MGAGTPVSAGLFLSLRYSITLSAMVNIIILRYTATFFTGFSYLHRHVRIALDTFHLMFALTWME